MSLDACLPARDRSQGDPRSFASLDGTVYLHIDTEGFDFYIQSKPDYVARSLCDAITQAAWWGLTLIDPDEDDDVVQLLEDGSVRQYMRPILPVNNVVGMTKQLDLTRPYQRVL